MLLLELKKHTLNVYTIVNYSNFEKKVLLLKNVEHSFFSSNSINFVTFPEAFSSIFLIPINVEATTFDPLGT